MVRAIVRLAFVIAAFAAFVAIGNLIEGVLT